MTRLKEQSRLLYVVNYLDSAIYDCHAIQYRVDYGPDADISFAFVSLYVTVPIGLRFSASAFVLGAGLTVNFPILARVNVTEKALGGYINWEDYGIFWEL